MKRGCPNKSKRTRPAFLRDYAKHARISRQAAAKQLRRVGIDYGKAFDFRHADELREASMHLARALYRKHATANGNGHLGVMSLARAQAEKETYKAALTRLAYQEKIGDLLSVDVVAHIWTGAIAAARSRLLGMPRKLAPLVLELRTADKVEAVLMKEIRVALTELSKVELDEVLADHEEG